MGEDAVKCAAAGTHGGGSDLAQAYAVSPAGTVEDESGRNGRSVYVGSNVLAVSSRLGVDGIHDKGGAVQVRFGQPAAYLEFFADGDGPLCAPDEQFDDASGCSSVQWPEFQHRTEVNAGSAAEQVAQFLLRVFDPPAVEIGGLLVVGVQDGG